MIKPSILPLKPRPGSPSGPLCAVAPVAPVAVPISQLETDLNQIFWDKTDLSKRKQWNQTWNQIFLVYPVYHLKDLELSIEIRRSPGPGAFFSWTF